MSYQLQDSDCIIILYYIIIKKKRKDKEYYNIYIITNQSFFTYTEHDELAEGAHTLQSASRSDIYPSIVQPRGDHFITPAVNGKQKLLLIFVSSGDSRNAYTVKLHLQLSSSSSLSSLSSSSSSLRFKNKHYKIIVMQAKTFIYYCITA